MLATTAIGNLGRDGELKALDGGSVLTLSVACKVRKGRENTTVWVRVSYWGKAAEAVAPYCTKGKTVSVRGEIQEARSYTNKDGTAAVSLEMRADAVELLGGGEQAPAASKHRTVPADARDDEMPF